MAAMTAVALPVPRPRSVQTVTRPSVQGQGQGQGLIHPSIARARTLRRRRVAALFIGLLSVAGLFQVAHLGAALLGGGPLTAPEEPTYRPAAAHVYVVQPGDTLWSIAQRVEPGADPRPLVQQLSAELEGAGLQPGQALTVP